MRGSFLCFVVAFLGVFFISQKGLEARICDEKHHLLPQVVSIFRSLEPVLKQSQSVSEANLKRIFSPETPIASIPLEDLNALAQEFFKRSTGVERWDAGFRKRFKNYRTKEIIKLFEQIGDISEVFPASKKAIDYIIVLGGAVERMQQRIQLLASLYQKGKLKLHPHVQVVLLAGDRHLNTFEVNQLKGIASLHTVPQTERQAIEWLWENMRLPSDLTELPAMVVEALGKQIKDPRTGKQIKERPSTIDTVRKWFLQNPPPGHCLAISSQPFVYYQQRVFDVILKQHASVHPGWTCETVGKTAPPDIPLSILLDNLARVFSLESGAGQTP